MRRASGQKSSHFSGVAREQQSKRLVVRPLARTDAQTDERPAEAERKTLGRRDSGRLISGLFAACVEIERQKVAARAASGEIADLAGFNHVSLEPRRVEAV